MFSARARAGAHQEEARSLVSPADAGRAVACDPEPMDAEDMLYILYLRAAETEGHRPHDGRIPCRHVRDHRLVFDLKDEDVYWCTLTSAGSPVTARVGAGQRRDRADVKARPTGRRRTGSGRSSTLRRPVFYTAPTAIRAFMRWGRSGRRHDLSSLRLLGSVGEPINPERGYRHHRPSAVGGARGRHMVAD
jgi:acetyl-CoA synthetase